MILQLAFLTLFGLITAEDYVHNPIQYHSQSQRGTYNWGYDTGLYGAHQFHQENRDLNGVVRGRYGYTDPDGKLRLTYYTSGKNGYKTWLPNVKQNIEASTKENYAWKSGKYLQSDESSAVKSSSQTHEKVQQHEHKYHEHTSHEEHAIKGHTKVEDKGKTRYETKGQISHATKGETKGATKSEIQQRKSYYSPVEYYKHSYGQQYAQQSQQLQESQQVQVQQQYNKPEPITPMQYRHIYQPNYAPSSRYSRCYCV